MSEHPEHGRDGHLPDDTHPGESDELLSHADETLANTDQTLADTDQTAADQDQALSGFDQMASDVDQHASDRDQMTADHDAASLPSGGRSWARYAVSRAERLSNSAARYATSIDRIRVAAVRDDVADRRDLTAEGRDASADARDRLAEEREARQTRLPRDRQAAVDAFAAGRLRAGIDRRRAAADRRLAAADRVAAAYDRQYAREALRHAHHDDVTGALRREIGELVMEHEVARAHDERRALSIASIHLGLAASDTSAEDAVDSARLVGVAEVIRRHVRAVDTVVRLADTTFVCAMPDIEPDDVSRRLDAIRADVAAMNGAHAVQTGAARLDPGETLEDVLKRAAAASPS